MGAGIEDIKLGRDLRISYAAFAVDGSTVLQSSALTGTAGLTMAGAGLVAGCEDG